MVMLSFVITNVLQLMSKDNEVGLLQKDISQLRKQYEKLIEIKQGLDLEISIYKEIIDGEEKRIRKYEYRNLKKSILI